ncbi:MAG: cytochrome c biogenesis CcdA family protein [Bacillota bacterium]
MVPALNLGVALVGGLVSFFSPCVLPLVPVYLTFFGGEARSPWPRLLLFVLGFTTGFTALGLGAGLVGQWLGPARLYAQYAGGLLLIVFGLHLAELIHIPALQRSTQGTLGGRQLRTWHYWLVGLVFSLAWTPCVGPVLAAILVLAGSQANVWVSGGLLLAYSAGFAIPFMVAGLLVDRLTQLLGRVQVWVRRLHIISGYIMIVMGLLIFTGYFELLSRRLIR